MPHVFVLSLLSALTFEAIGADLEASDLDEGCALQVRFEHNEHKEQAAAAAEDRAASASQFGPLPPSPPPPPSPTPGVSKAIPLRVQRNGKGEISPYMEVSSSTMKGFSRLLVDTGSSLASFCQPRQAISPTHGQLASCAGYVGNVWWGYAYNDSLALRADDGSAFQLGDGAYYAIMEAELGFCKAGTDGIFGIAFRESILGHWSGPKDPGPPASYQTWCEPNLKPVKTQMSPWMHFLDSKPIGQIGFHWTGELGDSQGMMYLGDQARSNIHYEQSTSVKARLSTRSMPEGDGRYQVFVRSFSIGGRPGYQSYTCPECGPNFQPESFYSCPTCTEGFLSAVLDTGTTGILAPKEVVQQFYNAISGGPAAADHPREDGIMGYETILIELEGPEGMKTPVLEFNVANLQTAFVWDDYNAPAITHSSAGLPAFVLGWIVWTHYYVVFDIADQTVEFVPRSFCKKEGAHTACPGLAGASCAGAECCPGVAASGNRTFPCPSAPSGFTGCETKHKIVNCLTPFIRPNRNEPWDG